MVDRPRKSISHSLEYALIISPYQIFHDKVKIYVCHKTNEVSAYIILPLRCLCMVYLLPKYVAKSSVPLKTLSMLPFPFTMHYIHYIEYG